MSPTEFQKDLREHCQKWQRIASSSIPANRKKVELCVKEFYQRQLKCEPPQCFWIESPRQLVKLRRDLKLKGEMQRTYSRGADFDRRGKIEAITRRAIQALQQDLRVNAAIDQIPHPLNLGRRQWSLFAYTERAMLGEHSDLRPYALIDFFISVIPRADIIPLKPWIFVIASCNGLWTLDGNALVMLDTPEILHTNEHGRLHCENGPALRYRGGTALYFLNGVRIPERYILTEPEKISLADVLAERNAQVRMALLSKIGFLQLLGTVRHWTISEANGNRLIEFRVKGTQFLRALHVKWRDKTGEKETVIPVPNRRSYFGSDVPDDIDDCEQVRRWTLGWSKEATAVAET